MLDPKDLTYLKTGTLKQQKVFGLLQSTGILTSLDKYDPILVGSYALGLDKEDSDIDIICCYGNRKDFVEDLIYAFGSKKGFVIKKLKMYARDTVIANFLVNDSEFEVFGQSVRTELQMGYRHLMIEGELLSKQGDGFRAEVTKLRARGMKTERAICRLMGLKGNPYLSLLKI